jgi:tetratricopeptide (TPR) repeat protein
MRITFLLGTRALGVALVVLLLSACATQLSIKPPKISSLSPLQTPGGELGAVAAASSVETPDLLGLSPEMRAFVDTYVNQRTQFQRLQTLHSSLRSQAFVGMKYDPEAGGTAAEAFDRGSANCLAYAHLFVSMARYAGLNARYLFFNLRPQWARHGDRVALRQHVNVLVELRKGAQYVVDIDPLQRDHIASARRLDDDEAFALYHGNLAMEALLNGEQEQAFSQAVRAIDLGAETDFLWVNLGAIYRRGGQDDAAEQSYLTALQLNPDSGSAMNNLSVLYLAQGDPLRSEQWQSKIAQHRQRNPYYHAYLGGQALEAGDPNQAIEHYRDAIALQDSDADFYYQLARVYFTLHQRPESIRYVEEAIARSRLVGEREEYQDFLRQLTEPALAQVQH